MVQVEKIPRALAERAQWVLWRTVQRRRGDKPTKVPFGIGGGEAKSNDPSTWGPLSAALEAVAKDKRYGIGFMFSAEDPFCGIDLDGCRDPNSGKVAEWAREIIKRFSSYCEVSPSQSGVKIFCVGKNPLGGGKKTQLKDAAKLCGKEPGIEVYDSVRYFAVTGLRCGGFKQVVDGQAALDWLAGKYWPKQDSGASNRQTNDDWHSPAAVLERARKYLLRLPPAVSGQGGHDATFHAACCLVLGFGLGHDDALKLLLEYNQTCQPPWSDAELLHKVKDAAKQSGPRNFLRNQPPQRWDSVQTPRYQSPRPKAKPKITTLVKSAHAYLDRLKTHGDALYSMGIPALDSAIGGGVDSSEVVLVGARPGHAKAQPLDSHVLTPSGWRTMGDLRVGDVVISPRGGMTDVVGVQPQGIKVVYRVQFSDGGVCECTEDHLWLTQTRNERRRGIAGSVKSLAAIQRTIRRGDGASRNHAVPVVVPVTFETGETLPMYPYVLGALLGDGNFQVGSSVSFCKPEPDIHERLRRHLPREDEAVETDRAGTLRIRRRQRNNEPSETAKVIAQLGLLGTVSTTKFIPAPYLVASIDSRLELLRGLLDTDGHVTKEGTTIEYSTSSRALADDVRFLSRSLGAIVRESSQIPTYKCRGQKKNGARSFRLHIRLTNGLVPVSSKKHRARFRPKHTYHRSIVGVTKSRETACQCISVASQDGLYVTDDFAVTHNSTFALQCAHSWTADDYRVVFVSEEMSALSLGKRALQYLSETPVEHWRHSLASIEQELKQYDEERQMCLIIENARQVSVVVEQIEEAVDKLEVSHVIVDYAQLLGGAGKGRYEEITNVSIALKQVANKHRLVLLVLAQLSREIEKRTKFVPKLSDFKESGQFEQDADVVLGLVWPHRIDSARDPHVFQVFVLKCRNREIHDHAVECRFDPSRQRITDLSGTAGHDEWETP